MPLNDQEFNDALNGTQNFDDQELYIVEWDMSPYSGWTPPSDEGWRSIVHRWLAWLGCRFHRILIPATNNWRGNHAYHQS